MVDPLRLRSIWLKLGYIGLYGVVVIALAQVLATVNSPEFLSVFFHNVLWVAAIAYGARIFRARGEEPVAPRPWWQLTGRPKAGIVLGIAVVGGDALGWASALAGSSDIDFLSLILNSVFSIVIAVAYFSSSAKLRAERASH